MARYVALVNVTDQGRKSVKDMPKRVEGARQSLKKVGGKLLQWYLTMGPYDAVAIVEVPDDVSGMQVLLAIGSMGDVRTTTLRAFTESEIAEMVEKLP